MFGTKDSAKSKGKVKKNLAMKDLDIDYSKRFKYQQPDANSEIYPLMYHLQRKEHNHFMRGAKTYAIKKITDGPR